MSATAKAITPSRERSVADLPVIQDMAQRYGLDAGAFVFTFKAVAMPQPHTDPEFVSCCMVAYQHQLNPLTKEIYFMRTKAGPIQAIVSVDGWIKKCNEHPQYDGMEIIDNKDANGAIESMTISIYRKDRSRPTKITEYMDECKAAGGPVWQKSPKRMLRNRTICQGGRVAFGFAGLMDRDEFDQWQATKDITPKPAAIVPVSAVFDIADIPDEPVAETADEPLADPSGFLAKLEEDRGFCESAEELDELRQSNIDMRDRLSDADKAKFDALFEVE